MSLPFLSAAIMLGFAISGMCRYWTRRWRHHLIWGIGLTMFTLATFAEGSFAVAGWDTLVFLPWHLRGTPLNAAWIGRGGLLLVRRPWARWLTASVFDPAWAMSEQERVIMSPIDQGGTVRLTTSLCHIYGTGS